MTVSYDIEGYYPVRAGQPGERVWKTWIRELPYEAALRMLKHKGCENSFTKLRMVKVTKEVLTLAPVIEAFDRSIQTDIQNLNHWKPGLSLARLDRFPRYLIESIKAGNGPAHLVEDLGEGEYWGSIWVYYTLRKDGNEYWITNLSQCEDAGPFNSLTAARQYVREWV